MLKLLRIWLVGLFLLSTFACTQAPAVGVVLDVRVPGPSNPVGPADFVFATTYPNRVTFDSGGVVVLSDVRFLDGFAVRNGTSVTIRDCYVHTPVGCAAYVGYHGSSLLMEDCQIGSFDESAAGEIGVDGDNVTLRRVKIEGYNDGIRAGRNSLYEQVWVTNMRGIGH